MYFIYALENKVNGKRYIGMTENLRSRYKNYQTLNCKQQPAIYNALKKYGFSNFYFSILEITETLEETFQREIENIKFFNSSDSKYGYNICLGGQGTYGRKASQKTLDKKSKSMKALWTNDEFRNKVVTAINSPESKLRSSTKVRKYMLDREASRANYESRIKTMNSEEYKKKMSLKTKQYWERKKLAKMESM